MVETPFSATALAAAPPGFHARHDAVARSYVYQVARRRTAFAKPFVWWIRDRLDEGANLYGMLPARFPVYPDILEANGYFVGLSGKGWGPGPLAGSGRARNPAGPEFKNFREFVAQVPKDKPFCFWYGASEPHRVYDKGSGLKSGKRLEDVVVPSFLPDKVEAVSYDY